ncbi:hemolysin family protein [Neolewinella antarctica]|uniref:CBS domain containing-hemolysin-like protein n=1 Tax=Neolewinella antarctica TaxID=442734 RepID=A0ABX0XAD0_9BACT|nr:hemolysin family protein [Neolewinella antarctica]NJC26167.1 CBS domain containing-hemolysin-like protein [Neolewinella antarctica]
MLTFAIIACLALSALFSGSEIAYVSANKLKVELKKKRGTVQSRILAGWYDRPSEFLSAMLVGNNIALVAFTSLITAVLKPVIMGWTGLPDGLLLLLCVTLVITIIVLIFGEYLPKTLFRLYADDALYGLSYPIRVLQWLLYLPSKIMTGVSNILLQLVFKEPGTDLDNVLTRLDLENFVNESGSNDEDTGGIDTKLFGNALNLNTVKVRDCMIPRNEIVAIDINATIDELELKFQESRLSRLLVYRTDVDEIEGYVHHHQLLSMPEKLSDIVLDITFLPEVASVTDVLHDTIKDRFSIACVVDEFGGVAGVITMEDMLEEIFGEIDDEHDDDTYTEEVLPKGEFLFSGRLEVNYLNEKYQLDLPETDYHTLSGLAIGVAETLPEEQERILIKGYELIMVEVSNTKVELIRMRPVADEDE